ncbi:hypothetical protein M2337_001024 [Sphingobium sp. B2D3A]|uniref:DUF3237 family protein n=1 Tax=unclassified Sphingobium TaxID=2611147 RepID=UPI00222499BC|nr:MULTISPECIES: DUF3237 family protein [unclassified Sphingobium]MCW2336791.1 hypothetical protein [Sphingobium sp. B2D3A]MCW2386545.1 hypothetical protein [Sphingobium sp. B2D3D]
MHVPALDLAFHVRLDFGEGPRTRFQPALQSFTRGFVALAGGVVSGPSLSGHVVPYSGGDWPRLWSSGLVEFEAHYMLEADDGAMIYIHNRGIAYANPEMTARIEAGEQVDPQDNYCRITPRFEAPEGRHAWLNRTVFVGIAERRGNSTFFDYYAVT